jgi:putative copper resistance protein D
MDTGTTLRGLARGLHIAASFCSFGTFFLAATLLRAHKLPFLKPLSWASLAAALGAGAAWFLLQTAYFASSTNVQDIIAASPIVAWDTRFGTILLARCAGLIAATLLFQTNWPRPAAALAAGTVLAQAWMGHGGAMSGPIGTTLLLTSIAHLAAAATWLGALPALRLAITRLPPEQAATLARNFSPIGLLCVATLVATAAIQYLFLIATPAALLTTAYGRIATTKIILLTALITIAATNRNTTHLPRNINTEIALGLVTLLAAGLILQLEPPGMAASMGQ